MQGDAMVLGAGEAFTNNGMLTAGKGNSVFSAQRLFLNAPGSLQAGGDVSLNSRVISPSVVLPARQAV